MWKTANLVRYPPACTAVYNMWICSIKRHHAICVFIWYSYIAICAHIALRARRRAWKSNLTSCRYILFFLLTISFRNEKKTHAETKVRLSLTSSLWSQANSSNRLFSGSRMLLWRNFAYNHTIVICSFCQSKSVGQRLRMGFALFAMRL